MSLGQKQIDLLAALGSPGTCIVVGDKVSASLARRGLLASRVKSNDSFYGITPKGLRALADILESGALDDKIAIRPKGTDDD